MKIYEVVKKSSEDVQDEIKSMIYTRKDLKVLISWKVLYVGWNRCNWIRIQQI